MDHIAQCGTGGPSSCRTVNWYKTRIENIDDWHGINFTLSTFGVVLIIN